MISSKRYFQKQSLILFETVLSIALFFIIFGISSKLLIALQEKSKNSNYQSVALLKLEATKQFLVNNKNFTLLEYKDAQLFYNGNLLLEKVSSYEITATGKVTTIDICVESNKVCSKWKIKN